MNYCPVCKREYKEMSGTQTRHCPICGSMLVQISDGDMIHVRRDRARKNE